MTPLVIGLTGYAQAGKDTVGARLVEKYGFTRFAFADALKSMALVLNPYIGFEVDEEGYGTEKLTRLAPIIERWGWESAKKRVEVRRFLQILGTEGVRNHLGDNAWVEACDKAIRDSGVERAVITDVRFPNEAGYVLGHGRLIRVVRLEPDGSEFDNGVGKDHPSEAHIAKLPADFNIVGISGQMDDLLAKADAVAEAIVE